MNIQELSESQKEDLKKMHDALQGRLHLSVSEIFELWTQFSNETYFANWMPISPNMKDEDIFQIFSRLVNGDRTFQQKPRMEMFQKMQKYLIEKRNQIKQCPCCNQTISDRDIMLNSGLIKALYNVAKWCQDKNTNKFMMKDVRHILGKNEYANFSSLERFGLVNKDGTASYQLDFGHLVPIFKGEKEFPLYITINQITDEVIEKKMGKISEVKKLKEWLMEENRLYNPKINPYRNI